MNDRYVTQPMKKIFGEINRFETMMKVEKEAVLAWHRLGKVPENATKGIVTLSFSHIATERILAEIAERELETQHDVAAFVSVIQKHLAENGRFFHMGLTSSDIVDTSNALILRSALAEIMTGILHLTEEIKDKALKYRNLECIGRTHGQHGEIMTFGLKFLNWADSLLDTAIHIDVVIQQISRGKISGAMGTYTFCPPEIEQMVCDRLDLKPAQISSQIIDRGAHAGMMNALALVACELERIAVDIRLLQQTEIGEVFESVNPGYKGSSAMPHKRNPTKCERICGLARLMRGYAVTGMENVALWHERDISHLSTERIIWEDGFNVLHYMIYSMARIVHNLEVDEDRVRDNVKMTGDAIHSQQTLLKLMDLRGWTRDEAYDAVQRGDNCGPVGIESPAPYVAHVDEIYSRFNL